MEKEINLSRGVINLNIFWRGQEPSSALKDLLEDSLEVLNAKRETLLKKKFKSIEANLNIVDDNEIKDINLEYREKDKATDVLSFPLQENVRRGEFDDFDGHLELGDIFVAVGVCSRQAFENGLTFDEEFVHLFIHGFLHLCGYDHEESEEEDRLMRALESEIMDDLAERRK